VIVDQDDFTYLSAEVLNKGGLLRFKARGCSMTPFVRDGAALTVEPVEAPAVRFGDIVFCVLKGRAVAHRVVGKSSLNGELSFLIRGDGASSPSEQVLATEVLGRVVVVEQYGKILRINNGLLRVMGLALAAFPALGRFLSATKDTLGKAAFRVMPVLQSFRLYRRTARRIIGKRVKYRTATIDDALDICRLLGYWSAPELSDPVGLTRREIEGSDGPSHILVATLRQEVVGAVIIRRFPEDVSSGPDWWISEVRVRVRYRGAGIGRGLIIKAGWKALARGAKRLGGDVSGNNTESVSMCESFRAQQIKPAEYSAKFASASEQDAELHAIFYRSIEDGLDALRAQGVLDRYQGRGCLDPD